MKLTMEYVDEPNNPKRKNMIAAMTLTLDTPAKDPLAKVLALHEVTGFAVWRDTNRPGYANVTVPQKPGYYGRSYDFIRGVSEDKNEAGHNFQRLNALLLALVAHHFPTHPAIASVRATLEGHPGAKDLADVGKVPVEIVGQEAPRRAPAAAAGVQAEPGAPRASKAKPERQAPVLEKPAPAQAAPAKAAAGVDPAAFIRTLKENLAQDALVDHFTEQTGIDPLNGYAFARNLLLQLESGAVPEQLLREDPEGLKRRAKALMEACGARVDAEFLEKPEAKALLAVAGGRETILTIASQMREDFAAKYRGEPRYQEKRPAARRKPKAAPHTTAKRKTAKKAATKPAPNRARKAPDAAQVLSSVDAALGNLETLAKKAKG